MISLCIVSPDNMCQKNEKHQAQTAFWQWVICPVVWPAQQVPINRCLLWVPWLCNFLIFENSCPSSLSICAMAPDARLSGQVTSFSTFSNILDSRLLRALADMGFSRPTSIQARTIPLALDEHRDILARARTGSGKTAAYCIPVVQKILLSKGKGKDKGVVSCVHLNHMGETWLFSLI